VQPGSEQTERDLHAGTPGPDAAERFASLRRGQNGLPTLTNMPWPVLSLVK
jgi:hypothetical protein